MNEDKLAIQNQYHLDNDIYVDDTPIETPYINLEYGYPPIPSPHLLGSGHDMKENKMDDNEAQIASKRKRTISMSNNGDKDNDDEKSTEIVASEFHADLSKSIPRKRTTKPKRKR